MNPSVPPERALHDPDALNSTVAAPEGRPSAVQVTVTRSTAPEPSVTPSVRAPPASSVTVPRVDVQLASGGDTVNESLSGTSVVGSPHRLNGVVEPVEVHRHPHRHPNVIQAGAPRTVRRRLHRVIAHSQRIAVDQPIRARIIILDHPVTARRCRAGDTQRRSRRGSRLRCTRATNPRPPA